MPSTKSRAAAVVDVTRVGICQGAFFFIRCTRPCLDALQSAVIEVEESSMEFGCKGACQGLASICSLSRLPVSLS